MRETTFVLEDTISILLESKKYSTLRDILITLNPADIALLFEEVPEERLPLLFRLLPKEQAAETFVEMSSDLQELLIRGFSDNELKEVVDELYVDDAADIVEEMPTNVVKRILRQADPEMRKMINEILKYPEDSAGSIMTTEYVSLRPDMTAEEAIKRIRRTGVDKETIYTCYVTREDRLLMGYISLKSLLLAEDDDVVREIMDQNLIAVKTTDDQEEVALMLNKYDFQALPVVDLEYRLVGIVTVDDAMDVMAEEATEDIERMSAIMPTDKPYLKTSVFELWKARIPWLVFLLLSATFTSKILQHYEGALAAVVSLTVFIPTLMGTGGNAGAQASAMIIRGIALNEVEFSDLIKVVLKELVVAILCGVVLAVIAYVKIIFIDGAEASIALVVALAVIAIVIVAKVVGGALPIIAKVCHLDPAVMSNPLITTLIDVVSLLVYFWIANLVLGI